MRVEEVIQQAGFTTASSVQVRPERTDLCDDWRASKQFWKDSMASGRSVIIGRRLTFSMAHVTRALPGYSRSGGGSGQAARGGDGGSRCPTPTGTRHTVEHTCRVPGASFALSLYLTIALISQSASWNPPSTIFQLGLLMLMGLTTRTSLVGSIIDFSKFVVSFSITYWLCKGSELRL